MDTSEAYKSRTHVRKHARTQARTHTRTHYTDLFNKATSLEYARAFIAIFLSKLVFTASVMDEYKALLSLSEERTAPMNMSCFRVWLYLGAGRGWGVRVGAGRGGEIREWRWERS